MPQIGHITSSSTSEIVDRGCAARRPRRRAASAEARAAAPARAHHEPSMIGSTLSRAGSARRPGRARSAPAAPAGRRGSSPARRSSRRRRCARRRPSAAAGRWSRTRRGRRAASSLLSCTLMPSTVIALVAVLAPPALQLRRLVAAGGAPRGPEVDQHPLAAVVGDRALAAAVEQAGSARSGTGSPTAIFAAPLLSRPKASRPITAQTARKARRDTVHRHHAVLPRSAHHLRKALIDDGLVAATLSAQRHHRRAVRARTVAFVALLLVGCSASASLGSASGSQPTSLVGPPAGGAEHEAERTAS